MRHLCLIAIALLLSCAPAPASTGAASPSASSRPTAQPSPTPAHPYPEVTAQGDAMRLSPDGQIVVSMVPGSNTVPSRYVFQRLDGTVVSSRDNVTGFAEWLADSSAVLFPLAAPQRAGPLGTLRPDGTLIETGLDDANPLLSPDGKWIAAERQEGCCMDIQIHEIRVAPRAGGPVRTLVSSTDPSAQAVSFLGWTTTGEVLYRDGAHLRRVTLDGVVSELPASAAIRSRLMIRTAISPDGQAILTCAADPLAFWVIAGGAIADLGMRPAWTVREPYCSRAEEVIWIGAHELAVRDGAGRIVAVDPTTGATRPLAVPAGATLIGASGDALLVAIDGDLHVLSGGADRGLGLRAGDYAVQRIAGGRFFLVNGRTGYLIG